MCLPFASIKSPITLFLFGDQTYSIPVRDIHRLLSDIASQFPCASPSSPPALFIRLCETSIQSDLTEVIGQSDVNIIWPAGRLTDLLYQWRSRCDVSHHPHHSDRNDIRRYLPLDMALLVVYQVLLFMRHIGSSSSAEAYADATVMCACTGGLAAAAVSCSVGLAELVPLGLEAVRMAFRVGRLVEQAAREASPATGTVKSWSVVVLPADERPLQGVQDCIERSLDEAGNKSSRSAPELGIINRGKARKRPCWTSAWVLNSVTLSGTPEALAHLVAELAVPEVRTAPIPIFGPFHCPTLHTDEDIAGLLASLDPDVATTPAYLPVISASTGKPSEKTGYFASLMRTAIEDMLLYPLRWDLVLQQLCERVETDKHNNAFLGIVPIATCADQFIDSALARRGMRRPYTLKSHCLESTTIHRVVKETNLMLGDGVYLVTEADLARADLREVVRGHQVEGKPLCTMSVFADIAMTLGNYLIKEMRPCDGNVPPGAHGEPDQVRDYLVTVGDMSVNKALVAGDDGLGSQLLQCHVQADWSTNSARCKFVVLSPFGKFQQHAECTIHISDTYVRDLLSQFSSGNSHRIIVSSLRSRPGTLHISGNMAYRLIAPLADFHRHYRLVRSLVLDSRKHEIAALVSFPDDLCGLGKFTAHPAVIDAFTQPAGFCLNLDDATDLATTVYANHSWDEMLLFGSIDMEQVYTVYVCMEQVGQTRTWSGDIIVLLGETIVAVFLRYTVKAFPRRAFSKLLRQETGMAEERVAMPPKTSLEAPRAALTWSPLCTPKPQMDETKSIERTGQSLPHDLSTKPLSANSAQSLRRTAIDDLHNSIEAQPASVLPDTSIYGNARPRGFDKPPSAATDGGLSIQDGSDANPIPPCKSVIL